MAKRSKCLDAAVLDQLHRKNQSISVDFATAGHEACVDTLRLF
jgi:hypothetical protein